MSWQERTEEKLRQIQELEQKRAEAQSQREAEKARGLVRKEAEEEYIFGLIGRLGVREKLEEIRRDVWKDGEIREYEERGEPFEEKSLGLYLSNAGWIAKRGISLKYSCLEPYVHLQPIYKRRFGFYKWHESLPPHGPDGAPGGSIEGTGFGSHLDLDKYDFQLRWRSDISYIQELDVFVYCKTFWYGKQQEEFGLKVGGSSLSLDRIHIEDTSIKKFLEEKLVENCAERAREKRLPYQLKERVELELVKVQEEIKRSQLKQGSS